VNYECAFFFLINIWSFLVLQLLKIIKSYTNQFFSIVKYDYFLLFFGEIFPIFEWGFSKSKRRKKRSQMKFTTMNNIPTKMDRFTLSLKIDSLMTVFTLRQLSHFSPEMDRFTLSLELAP